MTEHEVKDWLKRVYNTYREVESLETLLAASRMHAEGLDRSGKYNYTGKSDTRLNGTENAFIKLADTERRYNQQMQELVKVTEEVADAIALLNDNELEVILIHRYLYFHTIEQTAELMNYSSRTIIRKEKEAIKKLSCCVIVCHNQK